MAILRPHIHDDGPTFDIERSLGGPKTVVCGIDEAGRGPWAGPVTVAAVILNPDNIPKGLQDSKALNARQRLALAPLIKASATSWAIVHVSVARIDALNILQATLLGMTEAASALSMKIDHALVDGKIAPPLPCPCSCVMKGDAASLSIAAASILAKTARDDLMDRCDALYPEYGFKAHKGYGTPQHARTLRTYGPCPMHRQSFKPVRTALESLN